MSTLAERWTEFEAKLPDGLADECRDLRTVEKIERTHAMARAVRRAAVETSLMLECFERTVALGEYADRIDRGEIKP